MSLARISDIIPPLERRDPAGVLAWAVETWGTELLTFASSLGLEDQVILDILAVTGLEIPIFTIDTGRLFPEQLDLIDRNERRYHRHITIYRPDPAAVGELVAAHGEACFRTSVTLRQACCHLRKVEPLGRALMGKAAWITGLRTGSAATRTSVPVAAPDEVNGLIKLNPLWNWDLATVRAYIAERRVPYNSLHDRGYPSIGCACCTQATQPGEDVRAGRWWWESPEYKECGLHARPTEGAHHDG